VSQLAACWCICDAAATSRKWIEAKMRELGVSSNTDYKLCMMLDDLAMITVDTPTYGVIEVTPASWNLCRCINFFNRD